MKHKTLNTFFPFASAAVLIVLSVSASASAREHQQHPDGRVISQTQLENAVVTDLYLRTNSAGRVFLYIFYGNHTISVLDVTDPREPKQADALSFVQGTHKLHLRILGSDTVVATASPDPSRQLTVMGENATGTPEIEKQFASADAYTIDSGRSQVYVAERGRLSIIEFSHPVTKDAEIWEQWYESR